mmetsp:Transcript_6795/g.11938  ORF Transcript_6795/g.11938 Transcript_6795/m.11938 type:complete len:330 (-) Transcript_6795:142-1131(-)|eukprot:CAMPEP_0201879284 /NCGR_PEP_ID=MMETSP0902-20130614/10207_1 /ASSEMBLY_ACC=CAM_ASM_000551 /TAXON_ID=420261 /ORGANISM="Thalassiosira antarctica, Strain CCMP982" /LENGTH=329 /DNA_ID=CAMNT_0048407075 /DNA_START=8 /DNA_END=997 /DNA_ORIENTATION=+
MALSEQKSVAIMGAGSYVAGRIAQNLKENEGYKIIALVRPTTDVEAISKIADAVEKGDLSDVSFVTEATKGCYAIINFINQLMPPCDTVLEQLENDLKPIVAGLEAALANKAKFIHTSGNFSIPTKGAGNVFTNELPTKPTGSTGKEEQWDTFEHEGGVAAVATLAEAKHRQDWAVQDFVDANPESMACVIIPAGVFGPSIGKKITFWDWAAAQFLEGKFVDFPHAFIHIDDIHKVYLAVLRDGKPGGRYAAYGESMTVRSFVARYVEACGVPMIEDGPKCSDHEAERVYVDEETRKLLGVTYSHTLESSIDDAVSNLRERNLLVVGAQ